MTAEWAFGQLRIYIIGSSLNYPFVRYYNVKLSPQNTPTPPWHPILLEDMMCVCHVLVSGLYRGGGGVCACLLCLVDVFYMTMSKALNNAGGGKRALTVNMNMEHVNGTQWVNMLGGG